MAITTKREVAKIIVGNQNTTKHINQMAFKGIVLNNNPYDVDQLSFKNAKNVYVDENGTLISRPPISVEPLPTAYIVDNGISSIALIVESGYTLVDILETGKIKIYVSKKLNTYDIVAINKESSELKRLSNITTYHISIIDQYIIVFNNLDAKLLNINKFVDGWQLFRDQCEIPVTKRVVGQESFTYPGNQFTESYKEEYILSDELLSVLPEGTAEVTVNQSPENLTWTLENANINPEFRVLRSLNTIVQSSDLMTTATNINTGINVLAIAKFDYVMLSFDYGQTFERVLYPANNGFLQVASLSKDGLYFFLVAVDGVYRYTIGDKSWVVIRLINEANVQLTLEGIGINNACSFNNEEVFSFSLYHLNNDVPIVDVYWKGPNLKSADFLVNTLGRTRFSDIIYPDTKLNKTSRDSKSMDMIVRTDLVSNELISSVIAWLPGNSIATSTFVIISGIFEANANIYYAVLNKSYGTIDSTKVLLTNPVTGVTFIGVEVMCSTTYDNNWYTTKLIIGETGISKTPYLTYEYLQNINTYVTDNGAPINLKTGYLVDKQTYSVDGSAPIPTELESANRLHTISIDHYFYMMIGNVIYTNKLAITNSAILTYTRIKHTPFVDIPTVSYTSSELYLGFDNILKITANIRDGAKITFNLPAINNHSFTSSLNALINISTTEIAAFLINKVYIITTVADQIFGYRYDYLPTRLSIGVRLGDSVINTMNGVFTLYPTIQGLAIMNYQPDVANTDQIVEYVTKDIIAIWEKFYKGGLIKIVQMKDYIYLSNGTTTYLMLDLRGMTWWLLTSPFSVSKIVTNQFDFNIISNGLYKYDSDHTIYKDLKTRYIEWQIESQPNHFDAPNYYKNLKQLIFQLEEATNTEQTILIQMRLYRKQFALKEPETIKFKIDSYRTFVKRFNYWKINEMQWGLAADLDTANPAQLKLNGLTIKYEISEEVRS